MIDEIESLANQVEEDLEVDTAILCFLEDEIRVF